MQSMIIVVLIKKFQIEQLAFWATLIGNEHADCPQIGEINLRKEIYPASSCINSSVSKSASSSRIEFCKLNSSFAT